ncbi:MAG: GDSL-type esterase/lipase family protein [Planctomycetota bacterium]
MKRALRIALGVLVVLVGAECVARQPFLRTASPFEESSRGRVKRSEAWAGLLDFDVTLVPERLRVVWMGASTVAGVPYMTHMSPPGWLDLVLGWRGADVEVVPLAGPGLTAEALARLFPYALELSPDVIIVTTGHNEYLNADSLLDPHWWQDIQLVLRAHTLLGLDKPTTERLPTPEHDFDHAAIAAGFRGQLRTMQALADEAGVALLFTTPLVNLRQNPPILGDDPRLPEDADTAFARGEALLASRDLAGARAAFEAARDRDRWPHRATAPLLEALRETARRLVPVDAAFDAATASGIPGFELFADHCHPNPAGQRLLASTVADAIEDLGLMPATGRRGQAPDLAAGMARFTMDAEAIVRTRATLARGYVGFAMISGRYGRMAEFAEANLKAALAGEAREGELDTSFALLALLRGDTEAARRHLDTARAAAPTMLQNLQRAYNRYPWVREAFLRNGLTMEQARVLPEVAAGP